MSCDCEEEITVIQKLNRTLRQVNKNVRARLQAKLEEMDELFLLFCDTNQKAEEALWEIWATGKLDCDSDDYPMIAALVISELNRTSPTPTVFDDDPRSCGKHLPVKDSAIQGGLPDNSTC